jgi:spore maturation protein B
MILGYTTEEVTAAILVLFVVIIPAHGMYKRVPVFEEFVEGGKDGLQVVWRIMPFVVGMMTAIGMLKASGFFSVLETYLGGMLAALGFDSELLPLALVRPFSGQASNAALATIVQENGPDAIVSRIAATVMGSTETIFYVIPIYFGAVGVKKFRFTVGVSLIADISAFIAAIAICYWLL